VIHADIFKGIHIKLWLHFIYLGGVVYYKKEKFKGNLKHGYNTRGKIELHTQCCNHKSVVNMHVTLYNRLPERIKTLIDIKSFKKVTFLAVLTTLVMVT
jgi:hypothetical protein